MKDNSIRDYLNEGSIIKTRLNNSRAWTTNIVYSLSNDMLELEIGLEKNYINSIIMVGDTIECRYTTDDVEINIVGWVSRINNKYPQRLVIKIHQADLFENKRDCNRYDVYLSTIIKLKQSQKRGIFAILTNISKVGAAFIVNESFEKSLKVSKSYLDENNLYFEVNITLEKSFKFKGSIIRMLTKEKGIEYGIKFIDMEPSSRLMLEQLLTELANEDKEFYNKRSGFWSKNSKMK
ncbi:MAG: PilZ domain-containing protein [Bacillota bacterium]|nr:PilZ domain-containing protein [Bacillota bacterium]